MAEKMDAGRDRTMQPLPGAKRESLAEGPNLRRIGSTALTIGSSLVVVSVILFVLSDALDDRSYDLLLEGDMKALDVADMADFVNVLAWIVLGVAIASVVGGAIAYASAKT